MYLLEQKQKSKDYAFRGQFNEKPSIIPGCPEYVFIIFIFLPSVLLIIRVVQHLCDLSFVSTIYMIL